MTTLNPAAFSTILDNIPHVVMRVVRKESSQDWDVRYANKAVERYGYSLADFYERGMTWNDMLHPDDKVVALTMSTEYIGKGIDDFKLHYRILTKGGASIYVTDYSHVNRDAAGNIESLDSFLFEDLEMGLLAGPGGADAIRRNLVLNDILLTIQDAATEPARAIQFILDRAGALIDCSRALLFKDSADHRTCKVVYEWCNHGITSVKDLDYAITYETSMPAIYTALRDTGVLIVDAGEIPDNCKEEFEAESLVASAIFAVYQYGDHYGFVCFDDCIIERKWDPDTVNFLKIVANLLSNVVMNLQSVEYERGYEEKIKSLAFREYHTELPNHYPFDSDLADLILASSDADAPGYVAGVVLGANIAHRYGMLAAGAIARLIGARLKELAAETLGERAVVYCIASTVFAVLVQPGAADAVRVFTEKACALGESPWLVDGKEYVCPLNVAATPVGKTLAASETIAARLDAVLVGGPDGREKTCVFFDSES